MDYQITNEPIDAYKGVIYMKLNCYADDEPVASMDYGIVKTDTGKQSLIHNIHFTNGFNAKIARQMFQTLDREVGPTFQFTGDVLTHEEAQVISAVSFPSINERAAEILDAVLEERKELFHEIGTFTTLSDSQQKVLDNSLKTLDKLGEDFMQIDDLCQDTIISSNAKTANICMRYAAESFAHFATIRSIPEIPYIDKNPAISTLFTKANLQVVQDSLDTNHSTLLKQMSQQKKRSSSLER